jgi:diacylglycerol kinase
MDKVITSLSNAYYGLIYCFKTQRNMIIHSMVGIVVLASGLILKVSITEMLFLITAILFVLVAEAFNTALEKAIDLYTRERTELAKISKDVAAGAVLLASFFAIVVGIVILGPPLWQALSSLLGG